MPNRMNWHPFYEEWVVVAGKRQNRPNLPQSGCPFCPGSWKTPTPYEAISVSNDFPALSLEEGEKVPEEAGGLDSSAAALGVCEVVLYSSQHEQSFATLSLAQIGKVIQLWRERYLSLGAKAEVDYVFIFENKGREIGATIPHPHGQIYAFSFLPPKIHKEVEAQKKYFLKQGQCLGCNLAKLESEEALRKVYENKSFVVSVPRFARYPFESQILPKRHAGSLADFSSDEQQQLAEALSALTKAYDKLFGFSLPYMMLQHAKPTDGKPHPSYHYRISFLPLHRAADKLKYLAGCETGAGTFITDMEAEFAAEKLRACVAAQPTAVPAP